MMQEKGKEKREEVRCFSDPFCQKEDLDQTQTVCSIRRLSSTEATALDESPKWWKKKKVQKSLDQGNVLHFLLHSGPKSEGQRNQKQRMMMKKDLPFETILPLDEDPCWCCLVQSHQKRKETKKEDLRLFCWVFSLPFFFFFFFFFGQKCDLWVFRGDQRLYRADPHEFFP